MNPTTTTLTPAIATTTCFLVFLLFNVMPVIIMLALGVWHYPDHHPLDTLQWSSQDGMMICWSMMISALLFGAILPYMAHTLCPLMTIKQFFAVRTVHWRGLIHALSLLMGLIGVTTGIMHTFHHHPSSLLDHLITEQNRWWFAITIIIVAPIYEEFVFRGLIYGVIAQTAPADTHGTTLGTLHTSQWFGLLVSSILFTYVHLHYDGFELLVIFLMALLFGYVRIKYGILVAILLHFINNAIGILPHLY